jgi:hypothetical protein
MAEIVVYRGKCDKCGELSHETHSTPEEAERDAQSCLCEDDDDTD